MLVILITIRFAHPIQAYGPVGHEIVGAIADERLSNTETARKLNALIGGMTLEKASNIADVIKGWDKNGPDDPRSFHYSKWPGIDAQFEDFWKSNQPTHDLNSPAPSHHWFHYTDVPVVPPQRYSEGQAGRSKWDVVHMIPYCIDVLQGKVPDNNDRKITKPMAVILLAHFVADIHQPLHVGALYFDAQGNVVDPAKDKSALGDEGGNTFTLELSDDAPRTRGQHKKKLHGFWDYDAVNALFPQVSQRLPIAERQAQIEPLKRKLVHEMATHEPKNWRLSPATKIDNYAEVWADEILPIARDAYERLRFRNVRPLPQEDRVVATGEALEKAGSGPLAYRAWASDVVRDELHKAGWRLADLLEKALK